MKFFPVEEVLNVKLLTPHFKDTYFLMQYKYLYKINININIHIKLKLIYKYL